MAEFLLKRLDGEYKLFSKGQSKVIQKPWELELTKGTVKSLSIENLLPYLTSMEADLAMLKYMDVLEITGKIQITVPNVDFYMDLWQQARWDNTNLLNAESIARKAFAGLWGPQEQGNPRDEVYSVNNSGTFKSGYNQSRLTLLLERAGFCDISIVSNEEEIEATGVKTMNRGERQITTRYDQIRPDHLNRYEFACQQIGKVSSRASILDLACGIGYGTLMLATETGAKLTGVDIDQSAVEHAKQHFSNQHTQFVCQNAKLLDIAPASQDIVVSYETIEHVDFDQQLIQTFFKVLKHGGKLFCSTPNQDVMPFDKERFSFHIKHYTNDELVSLLSQAGFNNIELYAQHDPVSGKVVKGNDGSFTIAIATK